MLGKQHVHAPEAHMCAGKLLSLQMGPFTLQSVRDGIDEFRGNLAGTKSRIKEASNRINGSLGGFIEKKYW